MRRTQTAILAAGLAPVALSLRPAPAQAAPPLVNPVTGPDAAAPAPAAPPLDLNQRVRDTLAQDRAILVRDPNPRERVEAAKRLVNRQSPEADAAIFDVLKDRTNPLAQRAVANAVADDPTPDPRLIDLLTGLIGTEKDTTQDVAAALAAYRDPAVVRRARGPVEQYIRAKPPGDKETATRAAAVRGLANAGDKDAAALFIELINEKENTRPNDLVAKAAAESLAKMTHVLPNTRDFDGWRRWWEENSFKPADQFRAGLLDAAKRDQTDPAVSEAFIRDVYGMMPAEARGEYLLRCLSDPSPATRAAAVRLASRETTRTTRDPGAPNKPVLPRIKAMIGDSAPDVRFEVAEMLGAINDRQSLPDLLTQLRQEPDPTVRAALIRAVQPMQDPRAVPELLNRLRDPSTQVQAAAAAALGAAAPVIKANPAQSAAVVQALRDMITGPGRAPVGSDLRAAAADALGRLADPKAPDPALRALFLGLLDTRESKATRQAALRGLAALGEPRNANADAIVRWLGADSEPTVRLAALEALAAIGTFANANAVFEYTQPSVERDPSVNEQAFRTITALARTATESELQDWISTRLNPASGRRDVDHQIPLLQVLADKYRAAGKEDERAATLENIGDRYKNATNPRPDLAARFFDQALRYWLARKSQPVVTQQLMKEEVEALLAAKQYAEAARFAEEMTKADPQNEPVVAAPLTVAAETMSQARDFKGVQALAAEAIKINPPLSEPFRGRLQRAKAEADQAAPR